MLRGFDDVHIDCKGRTHRFCKAECGRMRFALSRRILNEEGFVKWTSGLPAMIATDEDGYCVYPEK